MEIKEASYANVICWLIGIGFLTMILTLIYKYWIIKFHKNTNILSQFNMFSYEYEKNIIMIYLVRSKFIYLDILPQHRAEFICCIAALFVGRIFNLIIPLCEKEVVNTIVSRVYCWEFIYGVTILKITEKFIDHFQTYNLKKIENSIQRHIRNDVIVHIHRLPYKTHLQKRPNSMTEMFYQHANLTQTIFKTCLFDIIPILIDSLLAVYYFEKIFLEILCVVVLTGFIYTCTLYDQLLNNKWQAFQYKIFDSLYNHETVKYFNAENHEIDKCYTFMKESQNAGEMTNFGYIITNMCTHSIIQLSIFICTLYAVFKATQTHEGLSVGDYTLFTSYLWRFYTPVMRINNIYASLQSSFIKLKDFYEFMDEEVEHVDKNSIELPELNGSIVFKNVHFRYKADDKPILKGISFHVNPGETVAIVGPSGSGKTTIYRLLLRFLETTSGEITIGGININDLSKKSLRHQFGTVPQEAGLFNETIEYNIKYGRMDATKEEVEEAAKAASIHEFISAKKDGYNTLIGRNGISLSGGEKQRLNIARVILKNPTYLLLDEATSSLDIPTEHAIQKKLKQICTNRTSLIIAHRLSTIVYANRIVVLNDGNIIETGSHTELLARKGFYHDMWEKQFQRLDI